MQVFIASADGALRVSLQLLVESEPGFVVIGMSDRSQGLLTIVRALSPDVLLLDYELAKQAVADLISDLHHLEHPPKVIVLSVDPQVKATTLAAGADAFISKNVPPDDLLPILREMRQSENAV